MSDTSKRLLKILIGIALAIAAIFLGRKILKEFRKGETE